MPEHDLVIRGATVVDGRGGTPYTADVSVGAGRITGVGRVQGTAARTVEADGAVVTPGFVDIHAHYDGQATWDSQLTPSAWHGVTTVVVGNCGVGFAPVRMADRDRLIELMEGVEDIPGTALHEGLAWDWESFPEYMDAVARRPHDIDIGLQVPHGALRLYVMGERGAAREEATAEDIAAMAELAREAVEAGALGFTTSRTRNHRTSRGDWTPTLTAAADELAGIASGLGAAGKGVLEVVSDFADLEAEADAIFGMVRASGRPLSVSITQADTAPQNWRKLMDAVTEANGQGLPVTAQVAARPVGVLIGLQTTRNPIGSAPSVVALAGLGLAEQVARLSEPGPRAHLLEELLASARWLPWERIYPLGDPPDYEPRAEDSVGARAGRAGREAWDVALDFLLADGGRGFLYLPFLNYSEGNLDPAREMLTHPHAVLGLADGGAHVGTICDASFPTTMLTHWVRDRSRGPRIDLAQAVGCQTARTAAAVGLADRGVVAVGHRADLNVIDLDHLTLHAPTMAYDLPAGGKRLLQRADGYLHTFVSGVEVYASGEHTGALPGRVVRGAQPAPA
ncbi:MAG TPA: amidohydrolase family protein [Acidimicrobiales bacterium]|nr:amidohydrolase family protein [Acidimicrobiales bacterium]